MDISGKIEIDGITSEFLLPVNGGSTQYSQWGASNTRLWPLTDLLEKLAAAALEWATDNLCTECFDKFIDDSTEYDGDCAECASRAVNNLKGVNDDD